ncbi:MAG: hypothetical protein JNK15_08885 [Planctomycetes bacterium]|nr:hypothetical protein [Planctomycetota bacterium]
MNCTTCRYELSQCLDGRLPSGRRTVVMEHAENCAECGRFWAELQAAQQLTLQLRRPRVGADFRDSLMQRIRAGEGTPEAVFREPVPLLAKVRYALTGAAAAAAVLLAAKWFTRGDEAPARNDQLVARDHANVDAPTQAIIAGGGNRPVYHQAAPLPDDAPFLAATKPLTFDLVVTETAKQLDLRHAALTSNLRRLADAGSQNQGMVQQVFENADEFQAFGELLLDLRNRKLLGFRDADVGADLRVAVDMLAQIPEGERDLQSVRTFVVPALRSDRLASVARAILVAPTFDRHEDLEALRSVTMLRPDVFPKLFFVLPHDTEFESGLGLPFGATRFPFDDCGPSYVAPRSEVDVRDGRLRIFRSTAANGSSMQLQIEIGGK